MTPERRIAAYYASAFGAIGSVAPFLALWLDSLGIDAGMVGIIVASPSIAMVFTTVYLGRRLDRLGERRRGIVLLNIAVLSVNALLVFVDSAWLILLVWTVGGILVHAMMPATDALALAVAHRRGSDWARMRLFGSIGFIVTLLLAGVLFEQVGIRAFLAVLLTGCLVRLLVACWLPAVESLPEVMNSVPFAATAAGVLPVVAASEQGAGGLYRPGVLLALGGAALINASHAFFYTFGMLAWTRAGIGETLGSVLWSVGVLAEVSLMWYFAKIAARLSARVCLLLAGGAGVLRWGLTLWSSSLPLLFVAQSLHALTFGLMYVATASFIARRVDESDAARGQSLSATLAAGSMAIATWGSGLLYERTGTAPYALMMGLCIVGIGLIAASYRSVLD